MFDEISTELNREPPVQTVSFENSSSSSRLQKTINVKEIANPLKYFSFDRLSDSSGISGLGLGLGLGRKYDVTFSLLSHQYLVSAHSLAKYNPKSCAYCKLRSEMIYYLKDLVDGSVFPSFSQYEMILSLIIIVCNALGILVSSLIFYSLVNQRAIPLDSRFVISLTIADFSFSSLILSINSINYSTSGWAIGKIGCQIEVAGIVYFIGTSIFSLFGLTAYRWLVVVKQIDITAKQVSIALFFIWGICACAIIPFAIYST